MSFIAIMLGSVTSRGTFEPPTSLGTGTPQSSLAVGDFNGDGIDDLAAGSSYQSSVIYLHPGLGVAGNGNGLFGARIDLDIGGTSIPKYVKSADLNQDGFDDLVFVQAGQLTVLMATGVVPPDGSPFQAPRSFGAGGTPAGFTLADLNSDGILDAVVSNYLYSPLMSSITVLLGQGTGGVGNGYFCCQQEFSTRTFEPLNHDPAIADLNSDGVLDVFATGDHYGWIYLGQRSGGIPTGTFAQPWAIPVGEDGYVTSPAALGDVDGDLIPDLIVPSRGGLSILTGFGDSRFSAPTFVGVEKTDGNIHVLDVTGDGKLDVVGKRGTILGAVWVLPNVCSGTDQLPPEIVSVQDVPFDQGGRVKLSWSNASEDRAGGLVETYRIWRSVPSDLARAAIEASEGVLLGFDRPAHFVGSRIFAAAGLGQDYYWEYLDAVPASGLLGYSYVARTTSDSIAAGNPFTAFFVQARSGDGANTWNSAADSGYSVDNLPPIRPRALAAQFMATTSVRLHWNPNPDEDLSHYVVHKGAMADFPVSVATLVGSTADTTFVDREFDDRSFYMVIAIDIHGNGSAPALLGPQQVSGVELAGVPAVSYLRQNYPNPFNPATTLEYGNNETGNVALRVFDPAGRLVRTLVAGRIPAGRYAVRWDGRDDRGAPVSSGIYAAEFVTAGTREVRKLVLIR